MWTELVFSFPCMSFVSLEHDASRGLVIESDEEEVRPVGMIEVYDWSADEWEDYGWEILYPETPSDEQ